jgi:hypothetical protein
MRCDMTHWRARQEEKYERDKEKKGRGKQQKWSIIYVVIYVTSASSIESLY